MHGHDRHPSGANQLQAPFIHQSADRRSTEYRLTPLAGAEEARAGPNPLATECDAFTVLPSVRPHEPGRMAAWDAPPQVITLERTLVQGSAAADHDLSH